MSQFIAGLGWVAAKMDRRLLIMASPITLAVALAVALFQGPSVQTIAFSLIGLGFLLAWLPKAVREADMRLQRAGPFRGRARGLRFQGVDEGEKADGRPHSEVQRIRVLRGAIEVMLPGETREIRASGQIDIPANTLHPSVALKNSFIVFERMSRQAQESAPEPTA